MIKDYNVNPKTMFNGIWYGCHVRLSVYFMDSSNMKHSKKKIYKILMPKLDNESMTIFSVAFSPYFQASRKTRPASGEVMTIQSKALSAATNKIRKEKRKQFY